MNARSDSAVRIALLLDTVSTFATPPWRTSIFSGPDLPVLPGETEARKDWMPLVNAVADAGLTARGDDTDHARLWHAMDYWWQQPLIVRAALIMLMPLLQNTQQLHEIAPEVQQHRSAMR